MTYSSTQVGESGFRGEKVRSSALWMGLFGLALLGCASSSASAESPAESAAAYQEPTPLESAGEDEGTEAPSAEPQGTAAEPASSEDLQQALQVVLQDESLLGELKLGEPGRFPLKISGSSLSGGLELKAHSEAVEVISAPTDTKTVAVLIFTHIDITSRQGTFKYRYDIEGVRGTSYVEKNDQGIWELKSSRFSEY